jgi:hypothetical protein
LCRRASRVRSPTASRPHWLTAAHDGDDQAAGSRGRVERFRNRDQRDAELLEEFQLTAEVFDGASEPVERRNDNGIHFDAVH